MYKIILPNFEGPFDLLLYFIKRDEINIYDIPIAKLADEFLNYIKLASHFNLELAGEFIVMASNLMYIKSQMLLPYKQEQDGVEIEEPRAQLVQNILEYLQYKEVAKDLLNLYSKQEFMLCRGNFSAEYANANFSAIYKNANLIDLLKAFAKAINRNLEPTNVHVVEMISITVEEKKQLILDNLQAKKRLTFFELVKSQTKQHIVVTFLAMLELMKLKVIFVTQDKIFEDIIIAEYPKELEDSF